MSNRFSQGSWGLPTTSHEDSIHFPVESFQSNLAQVQQPQTHRNSSFGVCGVSSTSSESPISQTFSSYGPSAVSPMSDLYSCGRMLTVLTVIALCKLACSHFCLFEQHRRRELQPQYKYRNRETRTTNSFGLNDPEVGAP